VTEQMLEHEVYPCKVLEGYTGPVGSHSSLNGRTLSTVDNSQSSYTMSPERKKGHLEMGRQLTS